MSESASLLLFGDEQISFPGIPRCAAEPRAEPLGESEAESGAESPPAGVLLWRWSWWRLISALRAAA